MWCTAGFLHAAGKKVNPDGKIVPLHSADKSVFSFEPVRVSCDDEGYTSWELNGHINDRFIFHVKDLKNYQDAMKVALKELLLQLPQ